MPMRGLMIVVASADQTRLRSALGLALSQAALGGAARLFVDTAAVALLRMPVVGDDDALQTAGGMPTLAALVGEARAAGGAAPGCPAGWACPGPPPADFDPRVAFGGMVGMLAALGDDRLVVV